MTTGIPRWEFHVEFPLNDADSSSGSHNSVAEPTYLFAQASVHTQNIAVLTELGRISSSNVCRWNTALAEEHHWGEMKSFKPTTSFASFHQVIRYSMAMQRFVEAHLLEHPLQSRISTTFQSFLQIIIVHSYCIPRGFYQKFNFPRTQRPFEMTYVIRENNYVHVSRWGGIQLHSCFSTRTKE